MPQPNPGVRARIAFAVAARESADYSRGLVGDIATPRLPGELIREARRLRVLALTVLDRAVLVERAAGASWSEIGNALGLPEDEARRRYQETFDLWATDATPEDLDAAIYGEHTTGLRADQDPEGTAASLDAWHARHAEPWEPVEQTGPVTRALL